MLKLPWKQFEDSHPPQSRRYLPSVHGGLATDYGSDMVTNEVCTVLVPGIVVHFVHMYIHLVRTEQSGV
jgi:hypothetical protein